MSTPSHTPEGRYRIEWNAKIRKWQIKIPGFNVAIGEFYDNSTSSREEITKMLEACAGIYDPATAIAKALDALNHIRALVVNENALTYDEIMEHVEKHADIGLAGEQSASVEAQREESIAKKTDRKSGCGSVFPRVDIICKECGTKKMIFRDYPEAKREVEMTLKKQPGFRDQRMSTIRYEYESE